MLAQLFDDRHSQAVLSCALTIGIGEAKILALWCTDARYGVGGAEQGAGTKKNEEVRKLQGLRGLSRRRVMWFPPKAYFAAN